jgi:hypothetical protein
MGIFVPHPPQDKSFHVRDLRLLMLNVLLKKDNKCTTPVILRSTFEKDY